MICMTFVAKVKQRGIRKRCNFQQKRALALMDVLLARANALYSTFNRFEKEAKSRTKAARETRSRPQNGVF